MSEIPEISEAESKVMRVLWRKAPQSTAEIIAEMQKSESWHPNTIKTLLTRLQRKKAVGVKKGVPGNSYWPLVTAEEYIDSESNSLLEKLFGGAVKPLLLHFARSRKLTRKDLDELRKLL